MKKAFVSGILVVLSFTASGCGPNADTLMKDQIKDMNAMADALENKAPKSKAEEIAKRIAERKEKIEELSLSDDEKEKLAERHDELAKATIRLRNALSKSLIEEKGRSLPGMPNPGSLP